MLTKYIDLEALNLRSKSVISDATRIAILHLGQQVQEIGPDSTPGWIKITTNVNGNSITGVVKAEIDGLPSLRDPVSATREALFAEAIKEWLRFKKG